MIRLVTIVVLLAWFCSNSTAQSRRMYHYLDSASLLFSNYDFEGDVPTPSEVISDPDSYDFSQLNSLVADKINAMRSRRRLDSLKFDTSLAKCVMFCLDKFSGSYLNNVRKVRKRVGGEVDRIRRKSFIKWGLVHVSSAWIPAYQCSASQDYYYDKELQLLCKGQRSDYAKEEDPIPLEYRTVDELANEIVKYFMIHNKAEILSPANKVMTVSIKVDTRTNKENRLTFVSAVAMFGGTRL